MERYSWRLCLLVSILLIVYAGRQGQMSHGGCGKGADTGEQVGVRPIPVLRQTAREGGWQTQGEGAWGDKTSLTVLGVTQGRVRVAGLIPSNEVLAFLQNGSIIIEISSPGRIQPVSGVVSGSIYFHGFL